MRGRQRSFEWSGGYFVLFVLLMLLPPSVRAQATSSLENGLARLTFDPRSGQFEVQAMNNGVLLLKGAPTVRVDDRTISAREASNVDVRRDVFQDALGSGEKLVMECRFRGAFPGFRYEIGLYRDKPWVSATAYVPKGSYRLGDFALLEGKLRVPGAFETRLYVNSGGVDRNTGTGVWELGMRRWESSTLSVMYAPRVKAAVGMGFYSFYRASTSLTTQYWDSSQVGVRAVAHYHGYRPENAELRTESLLIDLGVDPLKILEEWADAAVKTVHPSFNHNTRTGTFNSWFVYGASVTESDLLTQAKLLRDSCFYHYGITLASTGEWQVQRPESGDTGGLYGFGEDREDPKLYPHSVKWLIDQLHALGLQANFGANYAYGSLRGTMDKANAPWLIREDLSRTNFGYPIDFTHPGAQKWLFNLAKRTTQYGAIGWWTDFDGGPTRGQLHDPTKIMGFEDIREGLRVTREALGANVFIHKYCCGPYFTYLGLVDRARVGDDAHPLGDFEGLKAMARQLAGNYMLHQRFWINDPDPVFVGGRNYLYNPGTPPIRDDVSLLREVRMRLQYHVASGGLMTLGEDMRDMDAARTRLLTLALPSYGQAARPVDLFQHTVPEVYGLHVKTDWDEWHVLLLQNWNDSDKQYEIRFSELGLDDDVYGIYRFWDQKYLGEFRKGVRLGVGSRQGETFVVRRLHDHPWVLSTDMHLTQGGVEIPNVRYDESSRRLSGAANRHAGAEGHVVAFVPRGYRVRSASGAYTSEAQSSGASVVHLELKFDGATAPWSMTFDKTN